MAILGRRPTSGRNSSGQAPAGLDASVAHSMVYQIGLSRRRAACTLAIGRPPGCALAPPPVASRRMLCLDRITLREIQLALKEPFRISSGVDVRRGGSCSSSSRDRDGAIVWAECVALALAELHAGNDRHRVARDPRMARAAPARRDASTARTTCTTCSRANIRGHNMAKAALEMGCWGARRRARAACRSPRCSAARATALPTGISLGIQPAPDAARRSAPSPRVAAGYRKIKLKIQPGQDVEYVARRARRARRRRRDHGRRERRVHDRRRRRTSRELDAFDLIMLEQPLGADDLLQHAELQRRMTTPICLDESITDVDARARHDRARQRADHQHQARARRRIHRVEGDSRRLPRRAAIPVWCGGMLESGIGRAYNVALASLPNFSLPGDLSPSARYWARDIVTPEWTMDARRHGRTCRAIAPGLGVDGGRRLHRIAHDATRGSARVRDAVAVS